MTSPLAIVDQASDEGAALRKAALAVGYVSAADFDRIVNPAAMAGTSVREERDKWLARWLRSWWRR